jgi:hypothetical protein
MGQTEKLSNAFIEKQVDGVAPVLSPVFILYMILGITPPAVPFLLVATSFS